ncbi:hypothetical protein [Nocardiopsis deserti]|uniref:hypothetical protein n=1 Tax=Nocardiopsis deserti TaxID=2605988 RepID=UPI00123A06D7|nr:hypothetical protein [Nocardiopsis deserti]
MQEFHSQVRTPLLAFAEQLAQADSAQLADLISELLLAGRDGARIRPDEVMRQVAANLAEEDGETDSVTATVRLRLVAIYGGLRMDRKQLPGALREALAGMAVSVEEEEILERLYPVVRVETIELHDQDD